MDGYRRYNYGYIPEAYGFFNPFMKNINVAGGIGMLTNIIAQQQAQQREAEQQAWQRQMQEREMAATELLRGIQSMAAIKGMEPEPQKPSALQERINALITAGYSQSEAIKLATLGREPEKPERETPAQKNFRTMLQSGINRLTAKESKFLRPFTDVELMGLPPGTTPQTKYYNQLSNISLARDEMSRILSNIDSLSKEDKELGKKIFGNLDKIIEKGFYWEEKPKEEVKKAIHGRMEFNEAIKKYPDAPVSRLGNKIIINIEGKTYHLLNVPASFMKLVK